METLQRWALTACAAAILCTLAYRLFPENALGRQGRLLLPCLFLLVIVSPLAGTRWSFTLPELSTVSKEQTEALQARVNQQTVAYVNKTLLDMANQALSSYGVQAKKVLTDINIASDGSIDMGQITVYIDRDTLNMAAAVKQVVENRLGTAVVIALWEEKES